MLLSKYFLPILKEEPSEAQVISHKLMLRSGMIMKQASGLYTWLPLGLKVLKNIENIVRSNMNKVGALEVLMPCIQPAHLWIESGRFEYYGKEMLKFQDRHDNTLLFGPTNEDMITDIFRRNIKSYKDLPKNLYHIQWKFRDEIRPRFGVMRGREFLMKDAYSFDINQENAVNTYNKMYKAYINTFRDLGVFAIPVIADNGPIGGNLSHEFHIIAETGESTIYYDKRFKILKDNPDIDVEEIKSWYAAAEEKHDVNKLSSFPEGITSSKGIEVGHIFYIGSKYSVNMNALINDEYGKLIPVEMSSYGIGISRLAAAIIEANCDKKGIIWPFSVAPFKVSLINLNIHDNKCVELAAKTDKELSNKNIEVLYDDTEARPGSKFATHDLIGSPYQVIIGPKKAANNIVELKDRKTGVLEDIEIENLINYIRI
ncbi:proline--tRNA ligase [Rickettsia typhi]|uniref:Proline--tRNA ligase n=2 Tax=Rickettsia typhi TaxID=785 RepID=SYP_RICTY|nr:proline--tRNA ligase [Rickettsia typhi]Q68WZ3.1 RecName: Full=Proline--tRNA ligase; AltName: Full=Prolyl-tRNA synthetase; Short=ProRS [Rickettsia typhi str. Wilmington]AAU03849.1 Proline translase [Rickettsia typhi str. Wilmington]AFE54228.1 prolyl-tRNA synthetase [Rickettsia typhi str. TH1527]AFE55068.1 prolyl-tRNA synthetase [Rickettsia typhi str. B9991CWPP]